MHRIVTLPLRGQRRYPGPVEIRMTAGIVTILAGGRCIQCTGKAAGTWPTPVTIDGPAVLDKLRHGIEVRAIEISYIDGVLDVQVTEMAPEPRYRRQPCLPFGEIPVRPVPAMMSEPVQMALGF